MLIVLLALAVTVLDQVTKYAIRTSFALHQSKPVIDGLFDLTYVQNTGAAWGILGGQNTALTLLSMVMLILMVIFRRSFITPCFSHRLAYGLMIGGITGNLIDRFRMGWVTDFLDFYVGDMHWPSFNVADAAICVGVGLYIIFSYRQPRTEEAAPPDEMAPGGGKADPVPGDAP